MRRLLALALSRLGRVDEARQHLHQALEAAHDPGVRGIVLASVVEVERDVIPGDPRLEEALALLNASGDAPGVAAVEALIGSRVGDVEAMQRARDTFRRSGLTYAEAAVLLNMGLTLGRTDGALGERLLREGLVLAREVEARRLEVSGLNNLGAQLAQGGRFDEARPLFERALVLHRASGNREARALVHAQLRPAEQSELAAHEGGTTHELDIQQVTRLPRAARRV